MLDLHKDKVEYVHSPYTVKVKMSDKFKPFLCGDFLALAHHSDAFYVSQQRLFEATVVTE